MMEMVTYLPRGRRDSSYTVPYFQSPFFFCRVHATLQVGQLVGPSLIFLNFGHFWISFSSVHFFLSFRVTYIFPWDFPTYQSRLTSSLPTLNFMEMKLFHHQLTNLHNADSRRRFFEITIIQTLLNWNKNQILTRCLNWINR